MEENYMGPGGFTMQSSDGSLRSIENMLRDVSNPNDRLEKLIERLIFLLEANKNITKGATELSAITKIIKSEIRKNKNKSKSTGMNLKGSDFMQRD